MIPEYWENFYLKDSAIPDVVLIAEGKYNAYNYSNLSRSPF